MYQQKKFIFGGNLMFNKILMRMGMLLADAKSPEEATDDVLRRVINYINGILAGLIALAVAIGVVYAIVVGVRMARANNAEEREEAKKKVIYTVVGIAVAVALMLVLIILKNQIPEWLGIDAFDTTETTSGLIGL